ncbi:hypothetical protein Nhal_3296 [Nitrosococcus halophilus Nc 4]|uniref:Uncharacterized protein n=1 Tax=Nitrosococcus halophilus (strain Nc4) TaxID=472759 RepID=D5C0L7_NITHN|nr:putative Ig domain-containing protein [Nitrosococcus halophilus]ADE16340.1 hypothetical protein Nhal_3296 [Nitrosococcus halophilus Nc 4]
MQHYPEFNSNIEAIAQARVSNGDQMLIANHENALVYPEDMVDELHPSSSGSAKMATVWFEALQSLAPAYVPVMPKVTSEPMTDASVGIPYTDEVEAIGWLLPHYTLVEGPPDMSLHPDTGRIAWTPSVVGAFDVTIQVENSEGSDIQDFTINVN